MLRRQLETVNGVGQVMLVGGQARQINVNLDPMKLRAYRLTVADVAKALGSQNLQMPSGSIKVGPTEYTLRTMGRVRGMKEMNAITVANRDGRTITIGDLGRAEDSTEEVESASLLQRHALRAVEHPQAVGHQHRRSGQLLEGAAGVARASLPKGYDVEIVARPVDLHRGRGRYGRSST